MFHKLAVMEQLVAKRIESLFKVKEASEVRSYSEISQTVEEVSYTLGRLEERIKTLKKRLNTVAR